MTQHASLSTQERLSHSAVSSLIAVFSDSDWKDIIGHHQGWSEFLSVIRPLTKRAGKWTRVLRDIHATLIVAPQRGLLHEPCEHGD